MYHIDDMGFFYYFNNNVFTVFFIFKNLLKILYSNLTLKTIIPVRETDLCIDDEHNFKLKNNS